MPFSRRAVLLSALLFAACDSKIESTSDPAVQKQIQTVQNCFPELFAKAQGLLDLAATWRMNAATPIADPTGLTHSGTGPITATYTFDGVTLSMTIRCYDPDGNEQTGVATPGTSLAEKIDSAATSLRNSFPAGSPFLVGDWTLSGTNVSGSGALTGIIGGSTNGNELEELRTTSAVPSGGPPPVAASTIQEGACTMTLQTSSLVTDSFPTQEYPIGTLTAAIDGDDADTDTEVTVTVTFDNTAVIEITISGAVGGRFLYNVETQVLTAAV